MCSRFFWLGGFLIRRSLYDKRCTDQFFMFCVWQESNGKAQVDGKATSVSHL